MGCVENWHWTDAGRRGKLVAMPVSLSQPVDQLTRLAAAVRTAVDAGADWSHTAAAVADQLRAHLPGPEILTPEQRLGAPNGAVGHTLHVEPDGAFSITAVVWRPGQLTRIHDHTTWCVFGVLQGVEHEDVYDAGRRYYDSGQEGQA
jgi:3-mercaptopropionate dioxygenase